MSTECKYCGCKHTRVTHTYEVSVRIQGRLKTITRRRRVCRYCNRPTITVEYPEDPTNPGRPQEPNKPTDPPTLPEDLLPPTPGSLPENANEKSPSEFRPLPDSEGPKNPYV